MRQGLMNLPLLYIVFSISAYIIPVVPHSVAKLANGYKFHILATIFQVCSQFCVLFNTCMCALVMISYKLELKWLQIIICWGIPVTLLLYVL